MKYGIAIGLGLTIGYLAFCSYSLGYYVDPQEWFTGTYNHPGGHICLRSPMTCEQLARNTYSFTPGTPERNDAYSFDTGKYGGDASYDGESYSYDGNGKSR